MVAEGIPELVYYLGFITVNTLALVVILILLVSLGTGNRPLRSEPRSSPDRSRWGGEEPASSSSTTRTFSCSSFTTLWPCFYSPGLSTYEPSGLRERFLCLSL